jgi:hypothetical protein
LTPLLALQDRQQRAMFSRVMIRASREHERTFVVDGWENGRLPQENRVKTGAHAARL